MLKVTAKVDAKIRSARLRIRRELTDLTKGGGGVLAKRLKDEVGDLDRKQNQRHFATEGKSTGQRHPELKEPYKTRKRKKFGRKPILVATGRARDSLRFKRHPERVERTERKGRRLRLVFGSKVPYLRPLAKGNSPLAGPRNAIRKTPRQALRLKQTIARVVLRRFDEITGGQVLTNLDHRIPAAGLGRAIEGEGA